MICSAERAKQMNDPEGIWAKILPQKKVHVVFDKHRDVNSKIAAETLEAIFAEVIVVRNEVKNYTS